MNNSPTNVRWRVLWLLMAFAGLCHFNRISISVAGAEHLIKEYSLSETQMGQVYSAYLVAYTLCMMPGGWLIDRVGPKRALMQMGFGSALLVPMTGLTSIATPAGILAALCGIRALLGIVSAPMHPGAARAISCWMPFHAQGVANGMVTAAAVVGIASTYFVFGFLMDLVGWPWAFLIAGLVTLLLTIVWTVVGGDHPDAHPRVNAAERLLINIGILKPTKEPESDDSVNCKSLGEILTSPPDASAKADPWELAAMLRTGGLAGFIFAVVRRPQHRSMLLLMLSYAALSYLQYMLFYWIQYYFDEVLHQGKDAGRLYATMALVAMAIGMISGGWLSDRVQIWLGKRRGRPIVPACGMFMSAILLALGIMTGNTLLAVTCITLATGALGVSESSFWVTGVELGGKRGGLSAAILNTGGNVGGLPAPYLTPLISEYVDHWQTQAGVAYFKSWQPGMGVASIICFIGAGLWFWIDTEEPESSGIALAQAPAIVE